MANSKTETGLLRRGQITAIETLRVNDTADYVEFVPNVTFQPLSAVLSVVSIRGVNNYVGGLTDSVTASIDGLSVVGTSTGYFYANSLLDIQRIEVPRGPQGTLAGGNSLGGAINYVTNKPDPSGFEAELTADVARFDTQFVSGVVNVPLNDDLAIRVVAYGEHSDGAVRNAGPAGGSSGYENFGGRASLRWLPSDRLTIDLSVTAEDKKFGLNNSLPVDIYFGEEARADRIARLAALGGNYFDQDFLVDVGNDGGVVYQDSVSRTDLNMWMANAALQYEFDGHTFSFAYAHYDFSSDEQIDADRSEFPVLRGTFRAKQKSDAAELKLSSDYDGRFNWVGGVIYLDETLLTYSQEEAGDGVSAGSFAFDAQFAQPVFLERIAGYGSLFFDITDRIHVTAGLRYNREKIGNGEFGFFGTPGFNFDDPDPNIFRTNADFGEGTQSSIVPRIAINFDLSDDVTTYIQFSRGERSGYANPGRSVALGFAEPEVKPETLTNYEVGLKGSFLDNRVNVAAATFYADYQDLQVGNYAYVEDEGYVYFDNNAAEAYVRGFELEVQARPVPELLLQGTVGYVDTQIDEINYFGTILEDIAIPSARPWSVTAAAEYTAFDVAQDKDAFFRVDYVWRDKTYEFTGANEPDLINSYSVFDFSAGVRADQWTLTAYMENVFNDTYWLSNTTGSSLRGTFNIFPARTWGLRLNYRFGS